MDETVGGAPRRFDASQGPRKLAARDGQTVDLGSLGVRFMVCSQESGGDFSLVEHPIPPRTLAATPCRILEIISPGGFERFFEEFADALQAPGFEPGKLGEIGARYGLEFQPESVGRLCAEHGLDHPLLHIG